MLKLLLWVLLTRKLLLFLIILVLKHHEWLSLLNQRELIKLFLQTIMSFNNLFQILRTLKLLR